MSTVPTGPNVVLPDLNATLSENTREVMTGGRLAPRRILEIERYRGFLVDRLRRPEGREVHLFTVRRDIHRDATLRSIEEKTGWIPDRAWFNTMWWTGREAPRVKSALPDDVLRACVPARLYSLESNAATRRILEGRGVLTQRVAGPEDLPDSGRFNRMEIPPFEPPDGPGS